MIREVILLSLGLAVVAQWEIVPVNEEKRSNQILCGELLTNTLTLVCSGYYNSPFSKKSFEFSRADYDSSSEEDEKKQKAMFPFTPRRKALSALELRRIKRGVHDECCRKSCSINELRGYCGVRKSKK